MRYTNSKKERMKRLIIGTMMSIITKVAPLTERAITQLDRTNKSSQILTLS